MNHIKRIFGLVVATLLVTSGWAQMKFSFSGVTATEETLADGSTLITLPAGTDLNGFSELGMAATVAGLPVALDAITPNPSTTFVTDGEIEVFVYDGKAYSFRFTAGEYFTAIIFSDPHVEQTSYGGLTVANEQTFVNNICNLGKEGGRTVAFAKAPRGYVPTADIVFCLGDMDKDNASESETKNFTDAMQGFNDAGIPFVTLVGNHDIVGDVLDNGQWGLTAGTGGYSTNNVALKVVANQWTTAAENGDFEVTTIMDGTSHVQMNPFTFKFKGVRFYCGQTYWFQKPYSGMFFSGTSDLMSPTYYAPDGVIEALESFVDEQNKEAKEPSVWMQHYPFNFGGDCDRWWMDQNASGVTIDAEYMDTENPTIYTTAKQKKDKLASIINKTGNPVHFSGHMHSNGTNTYNGVTDKTIGQPGKAYAVLCKEGVGVVEIIETTFY